MGGAGRAAAVAPVAAGAARRVVEMATPSWALNYTQPTIGGFVSSCGVNKSTCGALRSSCSIRIPLLAATCAAGVLAPLTVRLRGDAEHHEMTSSFVNKVCSRARVQRPRARPCC